jgi:uncharacterized protein YbcC (UPF0753/DUF2309 family)
MPTAVSSQSKLSLHQKIVSKEILKIVVEAQKKAVKQSHLAIKKLTSVIEKLKKEKDQSQQTKKIVKELEKHKKTLVKLIDKALGESAKQIAVRRKIITR